MRLKEEAGFYRFRQPPCMWSAWFGVLMWLVRINCPVIGQNKLCCDWSGYRGAGGLKRAVYKFVCVCVCVCAELDDLKRAVCGIVGCSHTVICLSSCSFAIHCWLFCWTFCWNKFQFPTWVANFLVEVLAIRFKFVLVLRIIRLKSIRLWSDCVLSSLSLQFRILWAKLIVVTVISIQLSPDGPE